MIESLDMGQEWFVDGNYQPIFCLLSITVKAPSVIHAKQFVWITEYVFEQQLEHLLLAALN